MFVNETLPNFLSQVWGWQTAVITGLLLLFPFTLTYGLTAVQSFLNVKSDNGGLEPPPIPYLIPGLGNFFPFAFDTLSFMRSTIRKFGNIPARVKLGPEKIYFISGAQNLNILFNNSRDLTTKDFGLVALVSAFGLPLSDAEIWQADDSGILVKPHPDSKVPPENRLFYMTHHRFGSGLSGSALAELSRQFVASFSKQIADKREVVYDKWTQLPDVFELVRFETFLATTTALCGPNIFKMNPDLAEEFWLYDSWLPLILKRVPRWIIPRGYAIRDKMHQSIMRWSEYAYQHFDWAGGGLMDAWWEPHFGAKVMRDVITDQKAIEGLSAAGIAANNLGMIWAANANAIPATAWTLFHILADVALTSRIRTEIAPAFSSSSPDSVDISILTTCPLLQSIVAETLRLRVAVTINRVSMIPDFKMGKWTFQPGKMINASVYLTHRDESKWNTGRVLENGTQEHPPENFWAERFLEYSNDPLSGPLKPSVRSAEKFNVNDEIKRDDKDAKFTTEGLTGLYVPFGGGLKMCPGRHYAKQEICLAVAMLLWAFDFEFVDMGAVRDVKPDMSSFAVGTLWADRKVPVRIRKRRA